VTKKKNPLTTFTLVSLSGHLPGVFSFTNATTSLNILCAFTTTYFDIVILEHTLDCSVRVTGENVGCPKYGNFESWSFHLP